MLSLVLTYIHRAGWWSLAKDDASIRQISSNTKPTFYVLFASHSHFQWVLSSVTVAGRLPMASHNGRRSGRTPPLFTISAV